MYKVGGSENTRAVKKVLQEMHAAGVRCELRIIAEIWAAGGDGTDNYERADGMWKSAKPRVPKSKRRCPCR